MCVYLKNKENIARVFFFDREHFRATATCIFALNWLFEHFLIIVLKLNLELFPSTSVTITENYLTRIKTEIVQTERISLERASCGRDPFSPLSNHKRVEEDNRFSSTITPHNKC